MEVKTNLARETKLTTEEDPKKSQYRKSQKKCSAVVPTLMSQESRGTPSDSRGTNRHSNELLHVNP